MATFSKLSLRRMIIMPIITLGLYFWWWFGYTKDELSKAANQRIPNSNRLLFLYIFCLGSYEKNSFLQVLKADTGIMVIMVLVAVCSIILLFYNWVRYVQVYMKIVKKSADRELFFYYLVVGLLPSIISSSLFLLWLLRVLPNYSYELMLVLPAQFLAPLFFNSQLLSNAGVFEWVLLVVICVLIYLLNLGRMLIFQKGFNEYKE